MKKQLFAIAFCALTCFVFAETVDNELPIVTSKNDISSNQFPVLVLKMINEVRYETSSRCIKSQQEREVSLVQMNAGVQVEPYDVCAERAYTVGSIFAAQYGLSNDSILVYYISEMAYERCKYFNYDFDTSGEEDF